MVDVSVNLVAVLVAGIAAMTALPTYVWGGAGLKLWAFDKASVGIEHGSCGSNTGCLGLD